MLSSNCSCIPVVFLVLNPPVGEREAFTKVIHYFFLNNVVISGELSFSFSPNFFSIKSLREVKSKPNRLNKRIKCEKVISNRSNILSQFNDTELFKVFMAIACNSYRVKLIVEQSMSSFSVY